jgi:hypothetical protein
MRIAEFAKLFWANRGNHNDLTSQKIPARIHFRRAATRRHVRAT